MKLSIGTIFEFNGDNYVILKFFRKSVIVAKWSFGIDNILKDLEYYYSDFFDVVIKPEIATKELPKKEISRAKQIARV